MRKKGKKKQNREKIIRESKKKCRIKASFFPLSNLKDFVDVVVVVAVAVVVVVALVVVVWPPGIYFFFLFESSSFSFSI